MEQLTLGEIITELKNFNADDSIVDHTPHSWRWDYSDLALEKLDNMTTVWEFIKKLEECIWKEFTWYKGWEFRMSENTDVWLSPYWEWQNMYITWFNDGWYIWIEVWWYYSF